MNFTAEQALEHIKARLGTTQKLSDRTILDTVKSTLAFLPEGSDMTLTAFSDKIYPGIVSANTNVNHDLGEHIKEYEKKNPPKPTDPAKPTDPPTPPAPASGVSAEDIAKIVEATVAKVITPVNDKLAAIDNEKRAVTLKAEAEAIFMKNPLNQERKGLIDFAKGLATREIKDTDTAQIIADRMKAEYDSVLAAQSLTDGYTPADQSGGGGCGKPNIAEFPEMQAYLPKNGGTGEETK